MDFISGSLTVRWDYCAITLSNEYTSDRWYYSVLQELTDIPTNIPTDTLEVYFIGNAIDKIKANAFSGLSECKRLDLQYNTISEVELGAFSGLGNVTSLELKGNQLTSLKVGMFQGLVALEYLGLDKNHISSIEDNTFVNLKRLKTLSLSTNRLSSLSPGTFCGLESIELLRLEDNVLTSLPQDVFIHLPHPLSLNVSGNPFKCDDALCWLRQEGLSRTITWHTSGAYTGKPVCANGVNWDTWSCNQPDEMFHIIFCLILFFFTCLSL